MKTFLFFFFFFRIETLLYNFCFYVRFFGLETFFWIRSNYKSKNKLWRRKYKKKQKQRNIKKRKLEEGEIETLSSSSSSSSSSSDSPQQQQQNSAKRYKITPSYEYENIGYSERDKQRKFKKISMFKIPKIPDGFHVRILGLPFKSRNSVRFFKKFLFWNAKNFAFRILCVELVFFWNF